MYGQAPKEAGMVDCHDGETVEVEQPLSPGSEFIAEFLPGER